MSSIYYHKFKQLPKEKTINLFNKKITKIINKKIFKTCNHCATKAPYSHNHFHQKQGQNFDDGTFKEGAQRKTKEEGQPGHQYHCSRAEQESSTFEGQEEAAEFKANIGAVTIQVYQGVFQMKDLREGVEHGVVVDSHR